MMSEEQMDQRVKMMQDHMLQMHEIMDKIQATTDPAEKEKLKQQQRDMIKQHMQAHHQMMMQMQHQGGMSHGGSAGAVAKP
jgi:phosphate uptake regulator